MIRLLSFFLAGVCFAQAPDFHKAHVSFEINHLGVLTIEGSLDEISGSIQRISESEWTFKGAIEVNSIKTGDKTRDKTILTEQYLNAPEYPHIPFKGKIRKNMRGAFTLEVESEVRGLRVNLNTSLELIDGKLATKSVIISRTAIGLDFGAMDTLIGDEITIVIHSGIKPEDL